MNIFRQSLKAKTCSPDFCRYNAYAFVQDTDDIICIKIMKHSAGIHFIKPLYVTLLK